MDDQPLWTPSDERRNATRLEGFRRSRGMDSIDDLWAWSAAEPGEFWAAAFGELDVTGTRGERLVEAGTAMSDWRFLPDSSFNIAENYLADRPGAGDEAIVFRREDGLERSISWAELRQDVAAMAAALRAAGVEPGDRVGAWMPHVPETVIMFLAAASIGAVFTSTSADFGVDGVVDRFGQTEPKVLLAADGYVYGGKRFDCVSRLADIRAGLPSVSQVVVVGYLDPDPVLDDLQDAVLWDDLLAENAGAELVFEALPGDHPVFILYSSGTTGKPKCIVHRALGVALKMATEHAFSCDINPGDRVFYFTTCGWMMWNWLVGVLGQGATIVLYDGHPSQPSPTVLFDLVDELDLTVLGVSAKYIDASSKTGIRPVDSHDLVSLRTMLSTGSPLSHEGFGWVYDAVKADLHLASMSGGTDLCGCLVAGDPTAPVYAGELQRSCLGLDIAVFDDAGERVGPAQRGELVCVTPFPSMPLGFWGDDDGERYHSAYFDRFPGVWTHGDFASWTDHGGMIIHGRSDATLNASGVRIGTAEIYRVVEQIEGIVESVAIGQQWEGDTRIVLFVRLADGISLDDELEATVRRELRSRCSPRHVPGLIRAVTDIPRTRSGKITELAVTDVAHGREINNVEALANPEALEQFRL